MGEWLLRAEFGHRQSFLGQRQGRLAPPYQTDTGSSSYHVTGSLVAKPISSIVIAGKILRRAALLGSCISASRLDCRNGQRVGFTIKENVKRFSKQLQVFIVLTCRQEKRQAGAKLQIVWRTEDLERGLVFVR